MLLCDFDKSWTKRAWNGARALSLAVMVAGFATHASAQNLIQNGGVETLPTGVTAGYQITAGATGTSTSLPGWTTASAPGQSGIGCMEVAANASGSTHQLCGPNYGSPASTFS